MFGKLVDPDGGSFSIEGAHGPLQGEQVYVRNTNVLTTQLTTLDGSILKVTDFFPRFLQGENTVRPLALHRIVEPIQGSPVVRVRCEPVRGWEKTALASQTTGSGFRFEALDGTLQLATTMPLTYLQDGSPFTLKDTLYFSLTWNSDPEQDLAAATRSHLEKTLRYWDTWVKHCTIPSHYQRATIRSALALKLHCYEDTCAILAALTTSLPEQIGHERNWDYRFCWLRDAYFCLSAFRNLGHFEEMEGFLTFLLNIANAHDYEALAPVYRLDRTLPLPETSHDNWSGFAASRPVRSGNQAAEHVQNDVYGEMALTFAPIFFDDRFVEMRTEAHERLFAKITKLCAKMVSQPDAGLWELRNGWQEHSFSNLMCWAGLERASRIQKRGYLAGLEIDLETQLARATQALERAVRDRVLTNGPADATLDASSLLLPMLNFPDAAVNAATVEKIWKDLRFEESEKGRAFLYRYLRADDFGVPQAPFLICSFWLVQALAKVGRKQEALGVMEGILSSSNGLGLLAEHYHPATGCQSGNFPQAYSHVGLINAAFALSPEWDQVL